MPSISQLSPEEQARAIVFPNWDKITLSEKQADVFNYGMKNNFLILCAGRYFGKDFIIMLLFLSRIFALYFERKSNPNWHRDGEVVSGVYLAPTDTNSAGIWTRFVDLIPKPAGIARNGKPNFAVKQDAGEIHLFGGEIIIYFMSSFASQNLRGNGTDILAITEASYVKESDLIDVLFPFCDRAGYASIIMLNSTPKGLGSWFDQAVQGIHNKSGYYYDYGFKVFTGTSFDNPMQTADRIRRIKTGLKYKPYKTRREYLAWINQPMIDGDGLGEGESLAFSDQAINKILLNTPVQHQAPYYAGIDIATTGRDKLGVVITDKNGIVVHIEKHIKSTPEHIIELMFRIYDRFKPYYITFDNNHLNLAREGRLYNLPLNPLKMSNDLKNKVVSHFRDHMLHRSVRIPCPTNYWTHTVPEKYQIENTNLLLQEMYDYRQFTTRNDTLSNKKIVAGSKTYYHKGAGVKASDDILDALMMCIYPIALPYTVQDDTPAVTTTTPSTGFEDFGGFAGFAGF